MQGQNDSFEPHEIDESLGIHFDEARYNLATRIMSNGVEVIIASDKKDDKYTIRNSLLQKPNALRIIPNESDKPMTLAASTLKNHMLLLVPSTINISEGNFTIPIDPHQFITKTCLTTYTYRTTYLQNGKTTLESREKVISNIATEERNYVKMTLSNLSLGVTLSQTPEMATGTFPTTYSYFNTILDGELPIVVTSVHTVINTVTGPEDYISFLQPSEEATPVYNTNTYYSKIALTKTLREKINPAADSSAVKSVIITSINSLTQVVITESLPGIDDSTSLYTSYYSYETNDDQSEEKAESSSKNSDYQTNGNPSTSPQDYSLHIYATKTYQTTFTYVTTSLLSIDPTPESVNTAITVTPSSPTVLLNYRTRIIENVVTEAIPDNVLPQTLIVKLQKDLYKRGKNQKGVIVTMATLDGGQVLQITAMQIQRPSAKISSTAHISHINHVQPQNIPNNNYSSYVLNAFKNKSPQNLSDSVTDLSSVHHKNMNIVQLNKQDNAIDASKDSIAGESQQSIVFLDKPPLNASITDDSIKIKPFKTKNKHKTNNAALTSAATAIQPVNKIKDSNNNTSLPQNVNQLFGSYYLNRLNALKPMINAFAGMIQNNLIVSSKTTKSPSNYQNQHFSNDDVPETVTSAGSVNYNERFQGLNSQHFLNNVSSSASVFDGPIYIPVKNVVVPSQSLSSVEEPPLRSNGNNIVGLEGDSSSVFAQSIAQSLHISPPSVDEVTLSDENWIHFNQERLENAPQRKQNSLKQSLMPTYNSPMRNGGIPIRPGELITANSDIVVGKPNGLQLPRIPELHELTWNSSPHSTASTTTEQHINAANTQNEKYINLHSPNKIYGHYPDIIPLNEQQQQKYINYDSILKPPPLQQIQINPSNLLDVTHNKKQGILVRDSINFLSARPPQTQPPLASTPSLHSTQHKSPPSEIGVMHNRQTSSNRPHIFPIPFQNQLNPHYVPTSFGTTVTSKYSNYPTQQLKQKLNQELKNTEIIEIKRIPEIYSTSLPALYKSTNDYNTTQYGLNQTHPKITLQQHNHQQTQHFPSTKHHRINLDTHVLSHNIDIHVPPLTFNKDDNDHPFSLGSPVRGHFFSQSLHPPAMGSAQYSAPILESQFKQQSFVHQPSTISQVKIPLNEESIEVDLTPQNVIGSNKAQIILTGGNFVTRPVLSLEPEEYHKYPTTQTVHRNHFQMSSTVRPVFTANSDSSPSRPYTSSYYHTASQHPTSLPFHHLEHPQLQPILGNMHFVTSTDKKPNTQMSTLKRIEFSSPSTRHNLAVNKKNTVPLLFPWDASKDKNKETTTIDLEEADQKTASTNEQVQLPQRNQNKSHEQRRGSISKMHPTTSIYDHKSNNSSPSSGIKLKTRGSPFKNGPPSGTNSQEVPATSLPATRIFVAAGESFKTANQTTAKTEHVGPISTPATTSTPRVPNFMESSSKDEFEQKEQTKTDLNDEIFLIHESNNPHNTAAITTSMFPMHLDSESSFDSATDAKIKDLRLTPLKVNEMVQYEKPPPRVNTLSTTQSVIPPITTMTTKIYAMTTSTPSFHHNQLRKQITPPIVFGLHPPPPPSLHSTPSKLLPPHSTQLTITITTKSTPNSMTPPPMKNNNNKHGNTHAPIKPSRSSIFTTRTWSETHDRFPTTNSINYNNKPKTNKNSTKIMSIKKNTSHIPSPTSVRLVIPSTKHSGPSDYSEKYTHTKYSDDSKFVLDPSESVSINTQPYLNIATPTTQSTPTLDDTKRGSNSLKRIVLPTRYITSTKVLTVTTTTTELFTTKGGNVETIWTIFTKTHIATVLDTITYTHTLLQPTHITESHIILATTTAVTTATTTTTETETQTQTQTQTRTETETKTQISTKLATKSEGGLTAPSTTPTKTQIKPTVVIEVANLNDTWRTQTHMEISEINMMSTITSNENSNLYYNHRPSLTYRAHNISDGTTKYYRNEKPSADPNESIFIVMTDQNRAKSKLDKNSIYKVDSGTENVSDTDIDYDESISFDLPTRDEDPIGEGAQASNTNNHILIGGVLRASPPRSNELHKESTGDVVNDGKPTCRPQCKSFKNEVCAFTGLGSNCICRPGFARMFPDRPCKPTYTYVMQIQADRIGKYQLNYDAKLAHNDTEHFKNLAGIVSDAVDRMIMQSDFRDVYHGVHLTSFQQGGKNKQNVAVNFLLQLSDNSDDKRLEGVFKKYLRTSNYSIGGTELHTDKAGVDSLLVEDFDECSQTKFHDCSKNAKCFNLPGTYTCSCDEGYVDQSENTMYPGRLCSTEVIGCSRCHYHGKCALLSEDDSNEESEFSKLRRIYSMPNDTVVCKCFTWYAGATCQLNLKILLLSLIAIGTILFILLLVCLLMTCVKRRRVQHSPSLSNSQLTANFGDLHCTMTNTTDGRTKKIGFHKKRTMLIRDSSSESSQNSMPYLIKAPTTQSLGSVPKYTPESWEQRHEPKHFVAGQNSFDQSDRSLTVMIPRAKYHHPTFLPQTQLMHHQLTMERIVNQNSRNGLDSVVKQDQVTTDNTNSLKSPSIQAASAVTSELHQKHAQSIGYPKADPKSIPTKKNLNPGALVSAGFEVSATVTTDTSCIQQCIDESHNSNDFNNTQVPATKVEIAEDALAVVTSQNFTNQFEYNNYIDSSNTLKCENELDIWLDTVKNNELTAEARSFDETTVHAATKVLGVCYDNRTSNTNDEANTMAERDVGSTFLLPHTHLYKSERESDISGFDSF